jgi:hypothetical protein
VDVIARDLPGELRNFAEYARAVAADSMGPHRLTWAERAEWADACATAAEGAVPADVLREAIEKLDARDGWVRLGAVRAMVDRLMLDRVRGQ